MDSQGLTRWKAWLLIPHSIVEKAQEKGGGCLVAEA